MQVNLLVHPGVPPFQTNLKKRIWQSFCTRSHFDEEGAHDVYVTGELLTTDVVTRPWNVSNTELGYQRLHDRGVFLGDDRL